MSDTATRTIRLPTSLLIGEDTITDASGGVFDHIFPGTGQVNAVITMAGYEEIDRAVKSAAAAQRQGIAMTVEQRRDLLAALAAAVDAASDELAALNVHDYAVPIATAGNSSRAHRVARRLEAGSVWINAYSDIQPSGPYGGYKQSGYGRLGGIEGLDEFSQVKNTRITFNSH
jgi:aldehyde dehydrogenase (NAD+)